MGKNKEFSALRVSKCNTRVYFQLNTIVPGNLPCYKSSYLFASKGDSSIWISNFVSLIQDHIVPVMPTNVILHQPNVGVRSDQNAMTMSNISN